MTMIDAKQILRHCPPFRFIEKVTLLPNGAAQADVYLPASQPDWTEQPERSLLAAEAAAQTMGVLIRSLLPDAAKGGVLASITDFEWDCFAVAVRSLEVKHIGSRAAFHDFSAVFFCNSGFVCGGMRGSIHLGAEISIPGQGSVTPLGHRAAAQEALYEVMATRIQPDGMEMDFYLHPDCPVYAGHFPDAPITPGVLIAEIMVHAAQVLTPVPIGLRALRDLVLSAPLWPGDIATLKVRKKSTSEFTATLMRAGKRLARARLEMAPLPKAQINSTSEKGTKPMEMTGFSSEIAERIRNIVIYEGLELEELGIVIDEIGDDVLLFDDSGLDLDSVDALEVLAGVQREFGVQFSDIDGEFISQNCSTVAQLTRTVTLHLAAKDAA